MLKKGQTVRNFKILDTEKRLCFRQWRTYCYIECLLCHRKKWMREDSLKNEKVVSCGCYNKEHNLKAADFTGKTNKYGLKAIEKVKNDDDESKIIWKVQCVCGKVFEVASDRFCSRRSCGCLGDENRRKNMKKMHEKYYLENTNVLLITRNKPISSNKSGCTGVTYDKSRNKWVASIEFKGVRYHLGRYDLKKDAIEARKNAEENLYGNFMEWYSKQYPEIHTKIANTKRT